MNNIVDAILKAKISDILLFLALIALFIFIICGIFEIFKLFSHSYIKNHREKYFNNCQQLATSCVDLGTRIMNDTPSYYQYVADMGLNQVYHCSSSILSNAEKDGVKYLIKYSNLDNDMFYLERLDFCIDFLTQLENFQNAMQNLYMEFKSQLPLFVRIFANNAEAPYILCNLPTREYNINYPEFIFNYTSAAGKNTRTHTIIITPEIFELIKADIYAKINKSGHSKHERSNMTNDLRAAIKKRDNYTCQICGNNVYEEPNLLLEVDHIIPISKGGKTEASNLQTLCWKCNRRKSNN